MEIFFVPFYTSKSRAAVLRMGGIKVATMVVEKNRHVHRLGGWEVVAKTAQMDEQVGKEGVLDDENWFVTTKGTERVVTEKEEGVEEVEEEVVVGGIGRSRMC